MQGAKVTYSKLVPTANEGLTRDQWPLPALSFQKMKPHFSPQVPMGKIAYIKKNELGSYFVQWLDVTGFRTEEKWGIDSAITWAQQRFDQVIIHRS